MESKKSFIIYNDLIHVLEMLSDEEAGKLFKHILLYVNGKNPKSDVQIVEVVFANIKSQILRNEEKWNERAKRSRENGKKGGRPKLEDNNKK